MEKRTTVPVHCVRNESLTQITTFASSLTLDDTGPLDKAELAGLVGPVEAPYPLLVGSLAEENPVAGPEVSGEVLEVALGARDEGLAEPEGCREDAG